MIACTVSAGHVEQVKEECINMYMNTCNLSLHSAREEVNKSIDLGMDYARLMSLTNTVSRQRALVEGDA